MTLTTRTPFLRCGKRFGTEDEALHSKLYLKGGHGVVPCAYGCKGWHLERIQEASQPVRTVPRDTGPDRKTRALVLARDGHACVCCGESVLRRPHSIGHRLRASQGGKLLLTNLLTFLGLGNGMVADDHHHRIDQRKEPQDEIRGYTVRSRTDPSSVPVFYAAPAGRDPFWALLEADGGLVTVDAPTGSAA